MPREVHPDHCQMAFALCCTCKHKWMAQFEAIDTSLFLLECPNCHAHDSFPSFVPRWFIEALGDKKAAEMLVPS
jgi:hypothetical protein